MNRRQMLFGGLAAALAIQLGQFYGKPAEQEWEGENPFFGYKAGDIVEITRVDGGSKGGGGEFITYSYYVKSVSGDLIPLPDGWRARFQ